MFSLELLKRKPNDLKDYAIIYQKKFGHIDLHREFAINLWIGKTKKKLYKYNRFIDIEIIR